ncbi:glutamine synthetase family protein [Haladaptatus caseinilyticus]|uniref:glutamine synthetase family protein n=1 Tax=Haladaptatus caseinilyticus TaxID=2993314 RepID=UPI00224B14E0|nr:glutamine synthetase family protein [Haladaptatus caseinilyticus]
MDTNGDDQSSGAKMESVVQDGGIDHIFLEFADINGISRSKQLRADYFLDSWRDGFAMNALLLVQTPRSDIPTNSGLGAEIDYGDATIHPDPETFRRLPWFPNAARVLCSFKLNGEPIAAEPRRLLRQVIAEQADSMDLEFTVGSELEFYLLETAENTDGTRYEPTTDHKHECVTWATEEVSSFYQHVTEWAPEYGIDIHSIQHEHGAGQLEVLFDYGTALSQADTTFDFKRLVKRAAREDSSRATFMAKPFGDRAGSGYHLHVGAFENGENAFADDSDGGRLSDRGRYFVGGLLEHADGLAAIGTPTINGFKRYESGSFAPYTASWGYDNRMTALRVPPGVTRIENRIASADANPYLLIAATLAAGIDGIKRQLEPTSPVEGDPAGRRSRLPHAPELALQGLENDDTLVGALGEDFVRAYTATKRQELAAFRDVVTDWEREQYVETL